MKSFIYSEMMVHIPLCTNRTPNNILIISDNAELLEKEVTKHDNIASTTINCSLDEVRNVEDNSYDVVVCEKYDDSAIIAHINRILVDDGQLCISHPHLDNIEENKSLMGILGNYFKIIMPFNIGNGSTALLASKEYHPTADLNLHRSDMLDGLEYYNCDIHIASFAMGNNVRKAYLGTIKN